MEKKSLFPVVRAPEFISPKKREDLKYRSGVGFDRNTGDFIRDGSNKLVYDSGKEAYQLWCCKMVLTEKRTCAAYPNRYGAEIEKALKEPDEKAVESALQRTITEALKINPRTEYVRDFSFFWEGDKLKCGFKVKGINLEEFSLTVDTEKGGENEWE